MRATPRIRVHKQRMDEPERPEPAPPAPPDAILALQRSAGNQAVGQMLARNGPETKAPAKAPADTFKEHVKAKEWMNAVFTLSPLSDKEIQDLLGGVSADELDNLELTAIALSLPPMAGMLAGRVLQHIAFKRNKPPAPAERTGATVKKEGTLGHTAKVGGGEVNVRTGVDYEKAGGEQRIGGFSLGYKGPDADKTRWLQFIWREIIVDHPTKKTFKVDQEIGTTGGKYRLTTDPSKPSYNTDAVPGAATPFYEDSGVSNRTADATTIFDIPSAAKAIVDAQFADGATKVVSRAHFTTYLVRDMNVLYKVQIDVEWVFTSTTEPPRSTSVKSGAAASALDPEQRKRLLTQFPTYAYLP